MFIAKLILFLFCFSLKAPAAEEVKKIPLFISLGSHCEPSQQLVLNKMRSAAFPFDWLLTLDFYGFLQMVKDDFAYFMDRRYFIQTSDGIVLNTYYNIDFRHEMHDWPEDQVLEKHYLEIREKYIRRINRFKRCNENKGRAYFIRAAFDLNLNPFLPTITKECTKIDRFQAEELKLVLSEKFPDLDFYLVIVNYVEERAETIEGLDRVIEFKVRKDHKNEDYLHLFQSLIAHAQLL